MKQELRYCPNCKDATIHNIDPINHILHFLITILLCGFWLPVWILLILAAKKPTCDKCGCQQ